MAAGQPGTDTALMLALVHTLVSEGLHDRAFIERYCDGWATFRGLPAGPQRRRAKDAAWAAADLRHRCRQHRGAGAVAAAASACWWWWRIRCSAPSTASSRCGWARCWPRRSASSACRAAATTMRSARWRTTAGATTPCRSPALPQGVNGVKRLHSGRAHHRHAAQSRRSPSTTTASGCNYPDIRLAYWAGGNPFHHHQDLNRLRRGLRRLDTFVVHESAWTATARFADIVLPATMTLEREDIGGAPTDPLLVAMHRIAEPFGQARDDYEIFCDLARAPGQRAGLQRRPRQRGSGWQHLYERTRRALAERGLRRAGLRDVLAARRTGAAASRR